MTAKRKSFLRIALLASAGIILILTLIYAHFLLTTRLAHDFVHHLNDNYDIDAHLFAFETEEELQAYLTNIVTEQLNRSMFLRSVNVSFLDSELDHIPIDGLIDYFQIDPSNIGELSSDIMIHFQGQSPVLRTINININGHGNMHVSNVHPANWFKSLFSQTQ